MKGAVRRTVSQARDLNLLNAENPPGILVQSISFSLAVLSRSLLTHAMVHRVVFVSQIRNSRLLVDRD